MKLLIFERYDRQLPKTYNLYLKMRLKIFNMQQAQLGS